MIKIIFGIFYNPFLSHSPSTKLGGIYQIIDTKKGFTQDPIYLHVGLFSDLLQSYFFAVMTHVWSTLPWTLNQRQKTLRVQVVRNREPFYSGIMLPTCNGMQWLSFHFWPMEISQKGDTYLGTVQILCHTFLHANSILIPYLYSTQPSQT